jgi:TRAP-type C4-dicarboxylate transport system permease small subunit
MLRLKRTISVLTMVLGGIVLCLMAIQIVADVFTRAILGSGFLATAEVVAKYYMVAIAFLPLAFAELRRRHIEASIFVDMMPGTAQRPVLALGFFLSIATYALMAYGTAGEALKHTERRALVEIGATHFYTWPSYWILPVALALMVLVCLLRLIEVLSGHLPEAEDAASPHETATGDAA